MTPIPSTERLLREHGAWLRQLAEHLVVDPHEADDLAQAAALTVLTRRPRHGENVRGWLRAIVHGHWRNGIRDQRRRRKWERDAARPEGTPDTVDVIVRGHRVHDLIAAVCALDEPFRRAVMLRYFDDLPPRKIAAQLGVSVATVHSRLHRGRAKLRAALDERHGGQRAAWLLPMASFARTGGRAAWSIGRGVAAAAAVAVLTSGVWIAYRWASAPGDARGVDAVAVDVPAIRPPVRTDEVAVLGQRTAVPPAIVDDAAPGPSERVRGWVLGVDGAPRAGVRIEFRSAAHAPIRSTRSDRDGFFAVDVPRVEGRLVAVPPELVTVCAGHHAPGSELEVVVVVGERQRVAGRVIDPDGVPVPEATVALELPRDFDARFRVSMEASQRWDCRARTGADGGFVLESAPAYTLLRTTAPGFRTDLRPAPRGMDTVVELQRTPVSDRFVGGRVVGPMGVAVEGASVAIGPRATARTGPAGEFQIELAKAVGDEILVVAPGFMPVRLAARDAAGGRDRWPGFVRVQLRGAPSVLAGRVLDPAGAPVRGARVWLAQPELLGVVDGSPQRVENVAAGMPSSAHHRSVLLGSAAGLDALDYFNDARDEFFGFVETDRDGVFQLRGLQAASYEIVVMESGSLSRERFGPFRAGRIDLEVVMAGDRCWPVVEGVVVARDGTPLQGITVAMATEVARAEFAGVGVSALSETRITDGPDGPRTVVRRTMRGQSRRTDAAGRFRIERVPRAGVFLNLQGDEILDHTFELAGVDPTSVRIEASRRLRFCVESVGGEVDRFEMRDADGQRLSVFEIRGRQVTWHDSVSMHGATSPVYSVSERAHWLVLYRRGVEVRRLPAGLQVGEVTVLR